MKCSCGADIKVKSEGTGLIICCENYEQHKLEQRVKLPHNGVMK